MNNNIGNLVILKEESGRNGIGIILPEERIYWFYAQYKNCDDIYYKGIAFDWDLCSIEFECVILNKNKEL